MTRKKALRLREMILKASVSLSDPDALEAPELFPLWQGDGTAYGTGERVRFGAALYRCLQDHVAQPDWDPASAPSLWARVLIPDPEQIPDWVLPESTNPYGKGDKVRHDGKLWISDLDGNVWEPGVHGWTELG